MIVQPIKELYVDGNKITANKLRKSNIKSNISDRTSLECKFNELYESLETGNLNKVLNVLVNELFYEEVESVFIMNLYKAYNNVSDKIGFVNTLKESYIVRGIKSIRFAWSPIISRYNN